jgi:hypothetical protein
MSVHAAGQSPRATAPAGVELAGRRQWARSLFVLPGLFMIVVVICALAGATNWPVILTVMSVVTLVFEALLVRSGAPSLVVSPMSVVRRTRWRTVTVRADEVSGILIRHAVYGPVMVISAGETKVGLPLPAARRKPLARAALASFLRHAGVDAPSLRGLGLPTPVLTPRTVAGPILSRPPWPGAGPAAGASSPWDQPDEGHQGLLDGGRETSRGDAGTAASSGGARGGAAPPPVRVKGRVLAWISLAALALTAAVGLVSLFS